MKISKLADKLLKHMATSYSKDQQRTFTYGTFKEMHPDLDDAIIADSLYLLENDGLVSITNGSDLPYMITLNVNAIRDVEEDTFIKKGYTFIKEVRQLL